MRIAITGHTSPMGKDVYEHYSKTYQCLGISRTTGYDFTNTDSLNNTVSEVLARDVFLNIAHVGASQSSLLLKLQERWTHDDLCVKL